MLTPRNTTTNYNGIEFINTSVNEVLLSNIYDYLSTPERNFVSIGKIKVHDISRAGYRLLELPQEINDENKLEQYQREQKETIYGNGIYQHKGHFYSEGICYLIVSQDKEMTFKYKYRLIEEGTRKIVYKTLKNSKR